MSWDISTELQSQIDELVTHYPQPRSASLMILHLIQEQDGWISQEAVEWTAKRLSIQPINVYELVTFYPMFRQEPAGKYQIKICRTLSCALSGSIQLHRQLCDKLGLNSKLHGIQTTSDGRFSVEFVECLASCGTAPAVMCNDNLHESVSAKQLDDLLTRCQNNQDDSENQPEKAPAAKVTPRRKKKE
jgi:NADH-quinone oxidoreductase subunit E